METMLIFSIILAKMTEIFFNNVIKFMLIVLKWEFPEIFVKMLKDSPSNPWLLSLDKPPRGLSRSIL